MTQTACCDHSIAPAARAHKPGVRAEVARLGPGDSFGELALILPRPRTATVTLTAPSRLLPISAHNFRPMLMTPPEIQFKLLEALAERLAPSTT